MIQPLVMAAVGAHTPATVRQIMDRRFDLIVARQNVIE
jgi:hypothetical protein